MSRALHKLTTKGGSLPRNSYSEPGLRCVETQTRFNYASAAPTAAAESIAVVSKSSISVPFRFTQQGTATLVAHVSADSAATARTRVQVSHKSPCRWIPIIHSANAAIGRSTVALAHYGGGMAAGDSAVIDITVRDGAFLHCTSQGTNRIYKKRQYAEEQATSSPPIITTCMDTIVRCGEHSTCWMTPDPTQLQRNANYQQTTNYILEQSSSLVAVDWISAGRLTAGERWDHDSCRLRTKVAIQDHVVFVDAQNIPPGFHYGMDYADNVQFQTFGTIVLYNVDEHVLLRFRQVQRDLCRQHTAVRNISDQDELNTRISPMTSILSGRVILGMSRSECTSDLHIVRFTAESNEDIFRILHYCIGDNVYRERIRAVQSSPPIRVERLDARPADLSPPLLSSTSFSSGMIMMADSMFPIGSFAHSFGLEAAWQMGLLKTSPDVVQHLHASLRSAAQQSIPLIRIPISDPAMWSATNEYANYMLSANPPAYRASVEQAQNLQRIMDAMGNKQVTTAYQVVPKVVHFAPLWGKAATTTFAMTESEACYAFLHTIARDLVSAAVRMNLLGPMEGQAVLWKELLPMARLHYDPAVSPTLDDVTTSAPALEAIQPCHDLLAMRLFRS